MKLPWRRDDQQTDKAPSATMVPLGDVIAAITQASTPTDTGPAAPMPRPDEWFQVPFNPGQPLDPAAINPTRTDTGRPEPRIWEYPVSWNLRQTDTRLIPWKTLRDAADGPIVRQCIEARQRNLTGLDWDVTISQDAVNDLKKDGASTAEAKDALRRKLAPEIDRLSAFWRRPDPQQGLNFTSWLWQLMEEQLVLDAVAIYPRQTYGGDLIGLRVVDGSTIKPLLDADGARPEPPWPAYQQILYGFPRGEFNAEADTDGHLQPGMAADQLIYQRRNTRVWTPYGFSPVERALIDVDLYLKRHSWMRSEYDDSVAPEMVLKNLGTSQWTPQQVMEYERDFNDSMSGQTAQRMRARLLPPGLEPAQLTTIPERYKPEYDLHLIKLVASHLGVPITELGFSEAKGLGGSGWSEGQESVNYRGGTLPDARWWGALFTEIQRIHLNAPPELEFKFLGLDEEDETEADKLAAERVASGRMTRNEDRDRLGLPRWDIPEADVPMVSLSREIVPLEGAIEAAEAARQPPPPPAAFGGPPRPGEPPKPGEPKPGAPKPGAGQPKDAKEQDAAKAELVTFRKWARKHDDPKRPFEFAGARDVLLALAPDLAEDDRATFKAGDADPKGPDWPGWEQDQALAAHYARLIRQALAAAIDPGRLAADWLAARGVNKATDPSETGGAQDARQWLEIAGIWRQVTDALRKVLRDAWTEAWLVGHRAAHAVLTSARVDWSDWQPGNPTAARKLIGGARGLQDMLDHYGVEAIQSIASNRMDDLATALADALRDGDSVDELARDIRDLLDDPSQAESVATTEVARAQSQASMDTYADADVDRVEWMIAPTDACPICTGNAAEGPIRRGQDFEGGVDAPPQHPHCRCAIAPVI